MSSKISTILGTSNKLQVHYTKHNFLAPHKVSVDFEFYTVDFVQACAVDFDV